MANLESLLFLPNDRPFGLAFYEWTVKWWEWALQIPKNVSPLLDLDGKNAHLNTFHRNVIFLCQSLESLPLNPS